MTIVFVCDVLDSDGFLITCLAAFLHNSSFVGSGSLYLIFLLDEAPVFVCAFSMALTSELLRSVNISLLPFRIMSTGISGTSIFFFALCSFQFITSFRGALV